MEEEKEPVVHNTIIINKDDVEMKDSSEVPASVAGRTDSTLIDSDEEGYQDDDGKTIHKHS
jgi:hypothetical protein